MADGDYVRVTGTGVLPTWVHWNATTSSTSCTNSDAGIWTPWCTTGTSNVTSRNCWVTWNGERYPATASRDDTWGTWTVTYNGNPPAMRNVQRVTETPEQIALRERQQQQYRDELAARDRKRTQAAQRAERLLLELLDATQVAEYRKDKRFHVIGANGERYQVDATQKHGNIKRLGVDGKVAESLCVPLNDDCPTLDHVVAQLLALRHNIDHLLEKANRTEYLPDGSQRAIPRQRRA